MLPSQSQCLKAVAEHRSHSSALTLSLTWYLQDDEGGKNRLPYQQQEGEDWEVGPFGQNVDGERGETHDESELEWEREEGGKELWICCGGRGAAL